MTSADTRHDSVPAPTRPKRSMAPWPITRSDAVHIGYSASVLFVVTTLVGLTIRHLLDSTPLVSIDVAISEWFAAQRTSTFDVLTDYGSAFSDTITIVLALLVTVPLLVVITKRWNEGMLLIGAVAMETAVFVSAAFLVGRDRPPVEQLDISPPTASFPSGHTGAAFAFYVSLAVIVFWWSKRQGVRISAVVIGTAIPVIVALSRLYRGMHFTTDVIFGAVVGLVSVYVMTRVLEPRSRAGDGDTPRQLQEAA